MILRLKSVVLAKVFGASGLVPVNVIDISAECAAGRQHKLCNEYNPGLNGHVVSFPDKKQVRTCLNINHLFRNFQMVWISFYSFPR